MEDFLLLSIRRHREAANLHGKREGQALGGRRSVSVAIVPRSVEDAAVAKAQNMRPITWAGIVLIVLGAFALAYQGINYTRRKDVVDLGSLRVTTESKERIPLPPVLGGLVLVGGIILVIIGARKKP
jgi:uncharacterized membrane protein